MDVKIDEKIYHQIERKLSDNISDNLFATGNILEDSNQLIVNETSLKQHENIKDKLPMDTEIPYEQSSSSIPLTREEYIRQAREACLRQLRGTSAGGKNIDASYNGGQSLSEGVHKKRSLINTDSFRNSSTTYNSNLEESEQDIAAFRFLIIRMVCAFVLFLSVFLIDKFNITIGKLNPFLVKDYITGIDHLEALETFVLSLLK